MSALKKLLQETLVSTLIEGKKDVVSMEKHDTLEQGLKLMEEENALFIPIKDASSPTKYCGCVDILDIISSLVAVENELNNLIKNAATFSHKEVHTVMNSTERNLFSTIPSTSSVADLLKIFVKGARGAGVTNESGEVFQVATQFDVLTFLARHEAELTEALGSKTVKKTGLVKEWVLFVRTKEHALDAFRKMSENGVSAVAVVQPDQSLVANFSASDLRGLTESTFERISNSCLDFLKKQKGTDNLTPITCGYSSTFSEVVTSLVDHRMHRMWVVDQNNHPIGVVSLTDVFRVVSLTE
eukprot:TRINITY_DN8828_c0_g1_i1.p1 TRINITY_DN8828_c0_g1~~TRINITY_DN8828_c0_g1_i1.p1  ORF type:complete len:310 (-),score=90.32 TRINITY_DN8828_c0_g1_i1:65-961(-)